MCGDFWKELSLAMSLGDQEGNLRGFSLLGPLLDALIPAPRHLPPLAMAAPPPLSLLLRSQGEGEEEEEGEEEHDLFAATDAALVPGTRRRNG